MHVTYLICHHGPSVWDLHLSWFWKQDLWSLRQPACCFYSPTLALLLSLSLSQGIKVKTAITWSVKHSRLSSLCLFLSFPSTFCLFSAVLADLYVYPTASSADDQINVKEGWETEMDFEVKSLDEERGNYCSVPTSCTTSDRRTYWLLGQNACLGMTLG